eukprot:jgi/Bigna1/85695/estExt_fgenesh1_pg.C_50245
MASTLTLTNSKALVIDRKKPFTRVAHLPVRPNTLGHAAHVSVKTSLSSLRFQRRHGQLIPADFALFDENDKGKWPTDRPSSVNRTSTKGNPVGIKIWCKVELTFLLTASCRSCRYIAAAVKDSRRYEEGDFVIWNTQDDQVQWIRGPMTEERIERRRRKQGQFLGADAETLMYYVTGLFAASLPPIRYHHLSISEDGNSMVLITEREGMWLWYRLPHPNDKVATAHEAKGDLSSPVRSRWVLLEHCQSPEALVGGYRGRRNKSSHMKKYSTMQDLHQDGKFRDSYGEDEGKHDIISSGKRNSTDPQLARSFHVDPEEHGVNTAASSSKAGRGSDSRGPDNNPHCYYLSDYAEGAATHFGSLSVSHVARGLKGGCWRITHVYPCTSKGLPCDPAIATGLAVWDLSALFDISSRDFHTGRWSMVDSPSLAMAGMCFEEYRKEADAGIPVTVKRAILPLEGGLFQDLGTSALKMHRVKGNKKRPNSNGNDGKSEGRSTQNAGLILTKWDAEAELLAVMINTPNSVAARLVFFSFLNDDIGAAKAGLSFAPRLQENLKRAQYRTNHYQKLPSRVYPQENHVKWRCGTGHSHIYREVDLSKELSEAYRPKRHHVPSNLRRKGSSFFGMNTRKQSAKQNDLSAGWTRGWVSSLDWVTGKGGSSLFVSLLTESGSLIMVTRLHKPVPFALKGSASGSKLHLVLNWPKAATSANNHNRSLQMSVQCSAHEPRILCSNGQAVLEFRVESIENPERLMGAIKRQEDKTGQVPLLSCLRLWRVLLSYPSSEYDANLKAVCKASRTAIQSELQALTTRASAQRKMGMKALSPYTKEGDKGALEEVGHHILTASAQILKCIAWASSHQVLLLQSVRIISTAAKLLTDKSLFIQAFHLLRLSELQIREVYMRIDNTAELPSSYHPPNPGQLAKGRIFHLVPSRSERSISHRNAANLAPQHEYSERNAVYSSSLLIGAWLRLKLAIEAEYRRILTQPFPPHWRENATRLWVVTKYIEKQLCLEERATTEGVGAAAAAAKPTKLLLPRGRRVRQAISNALSATWANSYFHASNLPHTHVWAAATAAARAVESEARSTWSWPTAKGVKTSPSPCSACLYSSKECLGDLAHRFMATAPRPSRRLGSSSAYWRTNLARSYANIIHCALIGIGVNLPSVMLLQESNQPPRASTLQNQKVTFPHSVARKLVEEFYYSPGHRHINRAAATDHTGGVVENKKNCEFWDAVLFYLWTRDPSAAMRLAKKVARIFYNLTQSYEEDSSRRGGGIGGGSIYKEKEVSEVAAADVMAAVAVTYYFNTENKRKLGEFAQEADLAINHFADRAASSWDLTSSLAIVRCVPSRKQAKAVAMKILQAWAGPITTVAGTIPLLPMTSGGIDGGETYNAFEEGVRFEEEDDADLQNWTDRDDSDSYDGISEALRILQLPEEILKTITRRSHPNHGYRRGNSTDSYELSNVAEICAKMQAAIVFADTVGKLFPEINDENDQDKRKERKGKSGENATGDAKDEKDIEAARSSEKTTHLTPVSLISVVKGDDMERILEETSRDDVGYKAKPRDGGAAAGNNLNERSGTRSNRRPELDDILDDVDGDVVDHEDTSKFSPKKWARVMRRWLWFFKARYHLYFHAQKLQWLLQQFGSATESSSSSTTRNGHGKYDNGEDRNDNPSSKTSLLIDKEAMRCVEWASRLAKMPTITSVRDVKRKHDVQSLLLGFMLEAPAVPRLAEIINEHLSPLKIVRASFVQSCYKRLLARIDEEAPQVRKMIMDEENSDEKQLPTSRRQVLHISALRTSRIPDSRHRRYVYYLYEKSRLYRKNLAESEQVLSRHDFFENTTGFHVSTKLCDRGYEKEGQDRIGMPLIQVVRNIHQPSRDRSSSFSPSMLLALVLHLRRIESLWERNSFNASWRYVQISGEGEEEDDDDDESREIHELSSRPEPRHKSALPSPMSTTTAGADMFLFPGMTGDTAVLSNQTGGGGGVNKQDNQRADGKEVLEMMQGLLENERRQWQQEDRQSVNDNGSVKRPMEEKRPVQQGQAAPKGNNKNVLLQLPQAAPSSHGHPAVVKPRNWCSLPPLLSARLAPFPSGQPSFPTIYRRPIGERSVMEQRRKRAGGRGGGRRRRDTGREGQRPLLLQHHSSSTSTSTSSHAAVAVATRPAASSIFSTTKGRGGQASIWNSSHQAGVAGAGGLRSNPERSAVPLQKAMRPYLLRSKFAESSSAAARVKKSSHDAIDAPNSASSGRDPVVVRLWTDSRDGKNADDEQQKNNSGQQRKLLPLPVNEYQAASSIPPSAAIGEDISKSSLMSHHDRDGVSRHQHAADDPSTTSPKTSRGSTSSSSKIEQALALLLEERALERKRRRETERSVASSPVQSHNSNEQAIAQGERRGKQEKYGSVIRKKENLRHDTQRDLVSSNDGYYHHRRHHAGIKEDKDSRGGGWKSEDTRVSRKEGEDMEKKTTTAVDGKDDGIRMVAATVQEDQFLDRVKSYLMSGGDGQAGGRQQAGEGGGFAKILRDPYFSSGCSKLIPIRFFRWVECSRVLETIQTPSGAAMAAFQRWWRKASDSVVKNEENEEERGGIKSHAGKEFWIRDLLEVRGGPAHHLESSAHSASSRNWLAERYKSKDEFLKNLDEKELFSSSTSRSRGNITEQKEQGDVKTTSPFLKIFAAVLPKGVNTRHLKGVTTILKLWQYLYHHDDDDDGGNSSSIANEGGVVVSRGRTKPEHAIRSIVSSGRCTGAAISSAVFSLAKIARIFRNPSHSLVQSLDIEDRRRKFVSSLSPRSPAPSSPSAANMIPMWMRRVFRVLDHQREGYVPLSLGIDVVSFILKLPSARIKHVADSIERREVSMMRQNDHRSMGSPPSSTNRICFSKFEKIFLEASPKERTNNGILEEEEKERASAYCRFYHTLRPLLPSLLPPSPNDGLLKGFSEHDMMEGRSSIRGDHDADNLSLGSAILRYVEAWRRLQQDGCSPESAVSTLYKLFRSVDTTGSGVLSKTRLVEALKSSRRVQILFKNQNHRQTWKKVFVSCHHFIDSMRQSTNTQVSFGEFLASFLNRRAATDSRGHLEGGSDTRAVAGDRRQKEFIRVSGADVDHLFRVFSSIDSKGDGRARRSDVCKAIYDRKRWAYHCSEPDEKGRDNDDNEVVASYAAEDGLRRKRMKRELQLERVFRMGESPSSPGEALPAVVQVMVSALLCGASDEMTNNLIGSMMHTTTALKGGEGAGGYLDGDDHRNKMVRKKVFIGSLCDRLCHLSDAGFALRLANARASMMKMGDADTKRLVEEVRFQAAVAHDSPNIITFGELYWLTEDVVWDGSSCFDVNDSCSGNRNNGSDNTTGSKRPPRPNTNGRRADDDNKGSLLSERAAAEGVLSEKGVGDWTSSRAAIFALADPKTAERIASNGLVNTSRHHSHVEGAYENVLKAMQHVGAGSPSASPSPPTTGETKHSSEKPSSKFNTVQELRESYMNLLAPDSKTENSHKNDTKMARDDDKAPTATATAIGSHNIADMMGATYLNEGVNRGRSSRKRAGPHAVGRELRESLKDIFRKRQSIGDDRLLQSRIDSGSSISMQMRLIQSEIGDLDLGLEDMEYLLRDIQNELKDENLRASQTLAGGAADDTVLDDDRTYKDAPGDLSNHLVSQIERIFKSANQFPNRERPSGGIRENKAPLEFGNVHHENVHVPSSKSREVVFDGSQEAENSTTLQESASTRHNASKLTGIDRSEIKSDDLSPPVESLDLIQNGLYLAGGEQDLNESDELSPPPERLYVIQQRRARRMLAAKRAIPKEEAHIQRFYQEMGNQGMNNSLEKTSLRPTKPANVRDSDDIQSIGDAGKEQSEENSSTEQYLPPRYASKR